MEFLMRQFANLHDNFMSLSSYIEKVTNQTVNMAYEWPTSCKLWTQQRLHTMVDKYHLRSLDFHGCRFGVVSERGRPMLKPWTIKTNLMHVLQQFDNHICDKAHQKAHPEHKSHDRVQGSETRKTGYYPPPMTEAIHAAFQQTTADFQSEMWSNSGANVRHIIEGENESPEDTRETWQQTIGNTQEVEVTNNQQTLHSLGYKGDPVLRVYPEGILDKMLLQEADAIVQQLNCIGTTAAGLAYSLPLVLPYGCSYKGRKEEYPGAGFAAIKSQAEPGSIDIRHPPTPNI